MIDLEGREGGQITMGWLKLQSLLGMEQAVTEIVFDKFRNFLLAKSDIDLVLFKSAFRYEIIPDYLSGLVFVPWTWDPVTFYEMYTKL